jgi:hypothetical protein
LQKRIEAQFRTLFQEELPQMIHNLSKMFLERESIATSINSDIIQNVDSAYGSLNSIPKWNGNPDNAYDDAYILKKRLNTDKSSLNSMLDEPKPLAMERTASGTKSAVFSDFGDNMSTTSDKTLEFREYRESVVESDFDLTHLSHENLVANHLANLMVSNQTMSPTSPVMEHFTHRTQSRKPKLKGKRTIHYI